MLRTSVRCLVGPALGMLHNLHQKSSAESAAPTHRLALATHRRTGLRTQPGTHPPPHPNSSSSSSKPSRTERSALPKARHERAETGRGRRGETCPRSRLERPPAARASSRCLTNDEEKRRNAYLDTRVPTEKNMGGGHRQGLVLSSVRILGFEGRDRAQAAGLRTPPSPWRLLYNFSACSLRRNASNANEREHKKKKGGGGIHTCRDHGQPGQHKTLTNQIEREAVQRSRTHHAAVQAPPRADQITHQTLAFGMHACMLSFSLFLSLTHHRLAPRERQSQRHRRPGQRRRPGTPATRGTPRRGKPDSGEPRAGTTSRPGQTPIPSWKPRA